jgi:SAM-dependent methyltransferase
LTEPKNRFEMQACAYYTEKLKAHGPTAAGVDWNSTDSQHLRFRQLAKLWDGRSGFSIVDVGCGYGALATFLAEQRLDVDYQGYDVAPGMIAAAQSLHESTPRMRFSASPQEIVPADYSVASGLFNVKQGAKVPEWEEYVFATLGRLAALGSRGFGFNMLTSYSDQSRMRDDLYYGDPRSYFDYCKRNFGRHVALLHDYGLYEFTILVRNEPLES